MYDGHGVPAIVERILDAEDELAALTIGCRWARRECGADAAAFLLDTGKTIAGDGWPAARMSDAYDRTHPDRLAVMVRDSGVEIAAPVRYGGLAIGRVIIRGDAMRRHALVGAAKTLAVVCAPAFRSRLDMMATSQRTHAQTPEILGRSPAVEGLRDAIQRAAVVPFPVLIEGESGTGKELVARAIHRLSARRDRRLCAINCAALTDELAEAELFGHARGAFTGAVGPRVGLFEDAHRGSLFLDEVGELSVRSQAKLLRVLQEREVRRVGENAPRAIDVRVIAATNRSLTQAVASGGFREDLLFRLAVIRLRIPPLRDRSEDVPLLAQAFWKSLAATADKRATLGADALAALCQHHWPGNVRELQNTLAGLVMLAPRQGRITARHVAAVIDRPGSSADAAAEPLQRVRLTCERRTVAAALARHGGRRSPAARELGLTRQGLTKAIRRLGLVAPRDTAGVA